MTNRLAHETSPYLRQHAGNPVEWYPWGEEALRRARDEQKPILLSVGYSACHWCHVMAHESFEDPEVAAVMNRHFVNIKVDREERPDLDQIYQSAHFLLTRRSGGWPLTMFLTADQKPFFGGTYFPKTPGYGMPGFVDVLARVVEAFRERRAEIETQNTSLLEALASIQPGKSATAQDLHDGPLSAAIEDLASSFDETEGGFGAAPKFPHPAELDFCLRFGDRAPRVRQHALFTLEKMAQGGIYDQLGGGFCRYSVDRYWVIPHFEKMLYDNGPLLALYADAWVLTGNALYKRVAEETADWVMREMQSQEGGYYSSLDADSEHEEGKFYVWRREEIAALLSESEYGVVAQYYGLQQAPNFENRAWHLHVSKPLAEVSAALGLEQSDAGKLLDGARMKLFAAREKRVRPGRDDKVLGSWNALMIQGMARATRVFGRADWLASAQRAADFIFARMLTPDRLLATYKDGRAHLNAYLDDHAFLLACLVELLQAQFRAEDLAAARALADALIARFEDREAGGFFFVSHDHERLILRPKSGHDNATPSGNGVAAHALARLGHLLGDSRYVSASERTLRAFFPAMCERPTGYATLCLALAEVLEPTRTVILRGSQPALGEWQSALAGHYVPGTITLALDREVDGLPASLDKPAASGVNAYVCQGVTCLAPVDTMAGLQKLLERARVGA